MLRVVIAEDNLIVRQGLSSLLGELDGVEVVAACADLDGLLAAVDAHRPEIVVTDIRMPPSGVDEGIEAARRLRESHPSTAVLVLSEHLSSAYAVALLDGGSRGRGYLLKHRLSDAEHLERALRALAAGGSFIDDEVVDALVRGRESTEGAALRSLTAREAEILAEVAKGGSNAAIAEGLGISERAVEKHVSSIFTKLGLFEDRAVHRRVRAALLYLSHLG